MMMFQWIFVFVWMPETKGRTLEDLGQSLRGTSLNSYPLGCFILKNIQVIRLASPMNSLLFRHMNILERANFQCRIK